MTFVVTDNCVRCKYTDCVEVCPVDCFYEGENMLVINPDECIDCGVCEPECPAEAIAGIAGPAQMGGDQPRICDAMARTDQEKPAPEDADAMKDVPNKFETLFSPNPGTGD